jgi:bifunctional DNA-binding transcriptional regulator/antitoxin component of YhaV-PrlF toxin-antitoxin module
MKEVVAAVTRNGQVTILGEVRRHLGLGTPGRVAFVVEDGAVRLQPVRLTVQDLYGSVPALPGRETDDFDDLIDEAMQTRADRIVEQMRRQRP